MVGVSLIFLISNTCEPEVVLGIGRLSGLVTSSVILSPVFFEEGEAISP
jgi:hypothetical protein